MATSVHQALRLHITPDKFYIEALDNSNELLVIDRITQEPFLEGNRGQIPASIEVKNIYGIIGTIKLLAGNYLIVITERERVGDIDDHVIWKVKATDVISYKRTFLHLTENQIQDNKIYLSMLQHVLTTESNYFSYTYDLSHTLQRLYNTSPDFLSMSLLERADQRFVWNAHALRELAAQPELHRFALPIIHGFMSVQQSVINGHKFQWLLISRRCCYRAGVRYYMRGIDGEGHAANFIETEQILVYNLTRCSFVQTRGSVPFYWSQRPNLKYKPTPLVNTAHNQIDGYQRHFDAQIWYYGTQTIINLLDNKGIEKILVDKFDNVIKESNNPNIKYVWFDFHHECSKMRWHRLSILTDKLMQDQSAYGYFMLSRDSNALIQSQDGVFRTNCIDCLDRTNVVQSLLARRSLQQQLVSVGVLSDGERLEDQEEFEVAYKNVWADNADVCSQQYAGTLALKTDYTRTGQRTKWGLLKDGYTSAIRYYKNNFYDGFRQDAIDLFLGNYVVDDSEGVTVPSPFREDKDWRLIIIPVACLICFSMFIFSVIIPSESYSEQFLYVTFWGVAAAATLAVIMWLGQEYVDKPSLAQKVKVE